MDCLSIVSAVVMKALNMLFSKLGFNFGAHKYWLTCVRCAVKKYGYRTPLKDDKEVCNKFLTLSIANYDKHYLPTFIEEHKIEDSEAFLTYICKIARAKYSELEWLLR